MIVTPGPLDPPAGRLLEALSALGHHVAAAEHVPAGTSPVTLAVSGGPFVFNLAALVGSLAPRPIRILVLSRLGAHPDARAASLQRLWRLEEHVRGAGAPTLTLRFAPLVGEAAPLWRKLRRRPSLPRGGRQLLNPVLESDAIETLVRALADPAPWSGWCEVAGAEVWSLSELRDAASSTNGPSEGAAWEPELEEMAEHRLAESGPWASRFALSPGSVAEFARRSAA